MCFEDKLCFIIQYKVIGNTFYYELETFSGLQNIKEKYKNYFKDKYVESNHKIKWKNYFKEEERPDEILKHIYKEEFDIDAFKSVLKEVDTSEVSLFISFITKDGIDLGMHEIIYENTVNVNKFAAGDFRTGYIQREKFTLQEDIVNNLDRVDLGWGLRYRKTVIKNF